MRCCHWSPRWSRATPTSRSGRGSRDGASVARGPKREAISRAYNLILQVAVRGSVSPTPSAGSRPFEPTWQPSCYPWCDDEEWFFDTELLLLAERNDMRIHEVPVDWVDDPDSRVDVVRTAADDLRGVARMAKTFLCGRGRVAGSGSPHAMVDDMGRQLVTFAAIGTISTAVSLWLFLSLRSVLGAVAANAVAVGATALGNLWANHRYTFGGSGRPLRAERRRSYMRGAAVFLGGLVASSAALLGVQAAGGHLAAEVGAVLVTWGATALCRFAFLSRGSDRVDLAEGSR